MKHLVSTAVALALPLVATGGLPAAAHADVWQRSEGACSPTRAFGKDWPSERLPRIRVHGVRCGYAVLSWREFAESAAANDLGPRVRFIAEGASWRFHWRCTLTHNDARWSCSAPAEDAGSGVLAHPTHHGRASMTFTAYESSFAHHRTSCNAYPDDRYRGVATTFNTDCDTAYDVMSAYGQAVTDPHEGAFSGRFTDQYGDEHAMRCVTVVREDGIAFADCQVRTASIDGDDGAVMYRGEVTWDIDAP